MSVQERQEKLMDKLNLDGLSEWSPCNIAIVRELLFSYHNILGVPAPLSMKFASMMMNLSKKIFGAFLHLC